MKIELVEYSYTFNKGNYESEKIGVTARLEEGEFAALQIEVLKDIVHGRQKVTIPSHPKYTEGNVAHDPAQLSFNMDGAGVLSPKAVEEPKVTPVETSEAQKEKEPTVEAPKAKAKPQQERKVVKKVKGLDKKQTAYDVENQAHKNTVGALLTQSIDPMWKKNAERAKSVSRSMNGEAFLDEEGLVLQSFKDLLKERYESWKA